MLKNSIKHAQNIAEDFITAFHEHITTDLSHLDKKHSTMVKDFINDTGWQSSEKLARDLITFRAWGKSGYSDQSHASLQQVPSLIKKLKFIIKWFFPSTIQMRKYHRKVDFFDIKFLELIGGGKLLQANPVSKTPGNPISTKQYGYDFNKRWIRYSFLTQRCINFNIFQSTWLDIGPFYGGFQSIAFKQFPHLKCIMVDFPNQLLRAHYVLKTLYPNAHHVFPNQLPSSLAAEDIQPGSFVYIPVDMFKSIENMPIDLLTNSHSLGEMSRKSFNEYAHSSVYQNAKYVYLVNRFVSAPFYDKCYDNDLTIWDYQLADKKRIYFDIFPLSQLGTKSWFGAKQAEMPHSSQYFEVIYEH